MSVGGRSRRQSAVAVHGAQGDRRNDADDEGYDEEADDGVHLLAFVVAVEGDGLVLARIVAGEGGAQHSVLGGEVAAADGGRVAAAFDVDQQHGLVAGGGRRLLVLGLGLRLGLELVGVALGVLDVDVGAAVEVAGAAFAARAPRAVEKAAEVVAPRRHAGDRLLHEVGDQRRDGRVDVQRHQKQQRGAGGDGGHGAEQRRVEPDLLASRFLLAAFADLGQLRQLLLAQLLQRVQQ